MHESRSQKLKLAFGVNELAAELDCSARLVWKEIHSGRMAHTRIGRRVLVPKSRFGIIYTKIRSVLLMLKSRQ